MKTVTRLLIYRGDNDRVDQVLEKSLRDGTWDFGNIEVNVLTLPASVDVVARKGKPPFDQIQLTLQALSKGSELRMVQTVNLDDSVFTCPCGEMFVNSAGTSCNELHRFLEEHRGHTNGKCVMRTSADGARAYGGKVPPDEERDF